jgi:hypothetical protein
VVFCGVFGPKVPIFDFEKWRRVNFGAKIARKFPIFCNRFVTYNKLLIQNDKILIGCDRIVIDLVILGENGGEVWRWREATGWRHLVDPVGGPERSERNGVGWVSGEGEKNPCRALWRVQRRNLGRCEGCL